MNSGLQIKCRRLLLAFSPSLLSTIDFIPQLPTNCYCQMTMGQCIKTIFTYSKPFWRNILVNQTDQQGPCSNIFESNSPLALIGLVLGEKASFWNKQDENELIQSIIQQYSILFNTDEKPLHTYVQYWPKESLSRGCYAGVYPPSPSSTWRNRKKALVDGRIWLGSTEMALEWIGYIEGAIESGERFAQDIIDSF
jgi:monoamine oxidase